MSRLIDAVLQAQGRTYGDLASRDFDDLPSYTRWADENPILARDLPTMATKCGRHVYFRADPNNVADVRERIRKPDGTGAINCGDGELRAGAGCYSVVPPSRHPSGHVYQFLNPLPNGPLPTVDDLEAAGFISCHATESNRDIRGQPKQ